MGGDLVPEEDVDSEALLASLPFEPAPRTTEADASDDVHTTDRRLAESLYLLVKRNRKDSPWQFPQGKLRAEETLRQSSERVLDRAVGRVRRWFVGNAPCGHVTYAYPPELQQKRQEYGAKVFFYRAQLVAGNVKLETRLYTDYAWVPRSKLA